MRRRIKQEVPDVKVKRVEFKSEARAMVTVRKPEDAKAGALTRVAKDADEATLASVRASIPAMVIQLPQNEAAAFRGQVDVAVIDSWDAVEECIEGSRYVDKDGLAAFCQRVLEEVGA